MIFQDTGADPSELWNKMNTRFVLPVRALFSEDDKVFGLGRKNELKQRFEDEALPHIDSLHRFALSLAGDAVEADDLVQETFLKAFGAFDSFAPGTNCKAWLFRIMRNTYINRLRRSGREISMEDPFDMSVGGDGFAEGAFYRGPEAAAIIGATRRDLEEALSRLSEDFRAVVIMADVEGLAYREIADVMGIPIGTVMSRLFRARKTLREFLEARVARAGGRLEQKNVVPLFGVVSNEGGR